MLIRNAATGPPRGRGEALKIGVIADAHGNLAALEAVRDAMTVAAPDLVVNLGDLVSGPFDPGASAELQMRSGYHTIAGNHERQLQDGSDGAFDVLARPLLTREHWAWIEGLPATLTLCDGDVFACHGSPAGGDLEYMLEDVTSGRATLDAHVAIRLRLKGIGSASLVLCGHTHMPRMVAVDGVLIGQSRQRRDAVLPGPGHDPARHGGGQPARALRHCRASQRQMGRRTARRAL